MDTNYLVLFSYYGESKCMLGKTKALYLNEYSLSCKFKM